MKRKIFVGWTTKTSAILPKFFCPLFRHCVVVVDGVLIQIGVDGIRAFKVGMREIKKLEDAGWVFTQLTMNNEQCKINAAKKTDCSFFIVNYSFLTCVGFAKRALGIRAPFVWTPDQLFRLVHEFQEACR